MPTSLSSIALITVLPSASEASSSSTAGRRRRNWLAESPTGGHAPARHPGDAGPGAERSCTRPAAFKHERQGLSGSSGHGGCQVVCRHRHCAVRVGRFDGSTTLRSLPRMSPWWSERAGGPGRVRSATRRDRRLSATSAQRVLDELPGASSRFRRLLPTRSSLSC